MEPKIKRRSLIYELNRKWSFYNRITDFCITIWVK